MPCLYKIVRDLCFSESESNFFLINNLFTLKMLICITILDFFKHGMSHLYFCFTKFYTTVFTMVLVC